MSEGIANIVNLIKQTEAKEEEIIEIIGKTDEKEILEWKDEEKKQCDSLLMVSLDTQKLKVGTFIIDRGWLIDQPNSNKVTPLIRSTEKGYIDIVSLLIDKKCILNARDEREGRTALMYSITKNELAIASMLIEKGCDINIQDNRGYTSLLLSLEYKRSDLALRLIEKGCNINDKEKKNGLTALMWSLRNDNVAIASMLIEKGCELNTQDQNGFTALHWSLSRGHVAFASTLIEKGCDINIQDESGYTALILSLEKSHVAIASMLIEKGCDINIKDNAGRTALMYSINKGHVAITSMLIEKGCDIKLKDRNGKPALLCAVDKGQLDITTLLIEKGCVIESTERSGKTPIICSSIKGHTAIASMLIEKGCDIDAQDFDGMTALLCSSLEGHVDIASMLIGKGCNMNKKDEKGFTALMYSLSKGHTSIASMLIEKGCDLNLKDKSGKTGLIYALDKGHVAITAMLVEKGCQLSLEDNASMNKLFVTMIENGYVDIASKLCMDGFEKYLDNKDKNNSLHISVLSNQPSCVEMLLNERADFKALNLSHKTPLQECGVNTKKEIIASFINHDLPIKLISGTSDKVELLPHAFTLNKVLDGSFLIEDFRIELIEDLIKNKFASVNRYDIINTIAFLIKDDADRTIFETGNRHLKAFFNKELLFCSRYKLRDGPAAHKSPTSVVIFANDFGAYISLFHKNSIDGLMDEDHFVAALKSLDASSVEENLRINFKKARQSSSFHVDEFNDYCSRVYGPSQLAVLKFMRNEDQYQREVDVRNKNHLDSRYVLGLLDGPSLNEFQANILNLKHEHVDNITEFKFCIVLPAADRSLDAIYRQERPSMTMTKDIMLKLALGIKECHDKDVIHGDIKLLNGIRVGSNILVIDMDAAAKNGVDKICAKFSSSILPPECFAELKDNAAVKKFEDYWKEEKDKNSEQWEKVKPVSVQYGMKKIKLVVRSFRTTNVSDKESNKGFIKVVDEDKLPYKLVNASEKIDIWSFGAVLFTMCTGSSLVPANRDDDLYLPSSFLKAINWTDSELSREIKDKVKDDLAADLLQKILRKNPKDRLEMRDIITHPFFTGKNDGDLVLMNSLNEIKQNVIEQNKEVKKQNDLLEVIDKRTQKILKINEETFVQLSKTERVLLRGLFEATEVSVPSCFVILNQKLENEKSSNKVESSLDEVAEMNEKLSIATDWIGKLSNLGTSLSSAISSGDPSDLVNSAIGKITEGEKLYFYLVDEYTMKPVILDDDPSYPIEISTPAAFVPKVLPLMKVGLKAMMLVNGVSNIGQCFGLPLPSIPPEIVDKVNGAVGAINQESSVAEFDILQSKVDKQKEKKKGGEEGNEDSPESVRGLALRELQQFYIQNDSKNGFSGLQRVVTSEGLTCWTLPENVEAIKIGKDPPSAKTYRPHSPRKIYNDSLAAKDLEIKNLMEENERLKKL